MNDHDSDAALRFALRGLRREAMPARDLWPGIAQAIAASPQALPQPSRRGWALWPLALAASLTLVVGLVWRLQPAVPASPSSAPIQAAVHGEVAARIDAEYRNALQQVGERGLPPEARPGLQALDAGAAQIRQALRHAPDSPLLLDQLRRTYRQRLALSRTGAVA